MILVICKAKPRSCAYFNVDLLVYPKILADDIQHLLPRVIENVEERMENGSDIIGVASGFTDLDKMTSGLQPGDLIIIAGRPSMGKTSLALNIAENVAIDKKLPVAVFSMEMASSQLTTRLIGSVEN